MGKKILKLFLRFTLGSGFLSAVADRFGIWPQKVAAWGNWDVFLKATSDLIPFSSDHAVQGFAVLATLAEIVFGICLLLGIKVQLIAKLSGVLLLVFGVSMIYGYGIKAPFDYSVFATSAAAFALGTMKQKYLELA